MSAEKWETLRKIARRNAISAANSAVVWSAHPSYNTKGAVWQALESADETLLAVAEAEGRYGERVVCGIDREVLIDIRNAVKERKQGYEIPGITALATTLSQEAKP